MDKDLLEATVQQLRRGDTIRGKKVFSEGRWINFSGPVSWRSSRWVVGETPLSRTAPRSDMPSQYLADLEITARTEWQVGDLARIEWGSNNLVITGVDPLTWASPTNSNISNPSVALIPRIAPPRKPMVGDSVSFDAMTSCGDGTVVAIGTDRGVRRALVETRDMERKWWREDALTILDEEMGS